MVPPNDLFNPHIENRNTKNKDDFFVLFRFDSKLGWSFGNPENKAIFFYLHKEKKKKQTLSLDTTFFDIKLW